MPQGQKRHHPKSSVYKKRRLFPTRPLSVAGLNSKVNRQRRLDTEYTQYQNTLPSLGMGATNVWHLTQMSSWVKRFGPDPGGVASLLKLDYDFQFKTDTEPGPTTLTAFLVTLKHDTMSQLTENAGSDLTALVENIHYLTGTAPDGGLTITSGQGFLNPVYFNIHKTWKFSLGIKQYDSVPTNSRTDRDMYRITGTYYHKRKLVNGRGNFDPALMTTCANDAKVFLIVFSDNISAIEGSPRLDGTCVATVKSV